MNLGSFTEILPVVIALVVEISQFLGTGTITVNFQWILLPFSLGKNPIRIQQVNAGNLFLFFFFFFFAAAGAALVSGLPSVFVSAVVTSVGVDTTVSVVFTAISFASLS